MNRHRSGAAGSGAWSTSGSTALGALWPIVLAVAVTAVLAAVIAGFVVGSGGVVGALSAGAVVIIFFGSTPLVLSPVASKRPALSLPIAVLFFMVKAFTAMAVLFLVFDVGAVSEAVDKTTFGLVTAGCALVWVALQTRAFTRARVLAYDLDNEG